ncbi:hypothetical protein Tco_0416963 [Tanacetum coccineum]
MKTEDAHRCGEECYVVAFDEKESTEKGDITEDVKKFMKLAGMKWWQGNGARGLGSKRKEVKILLRKKLQRLSL